MLFYFVSIALGSLQFRLACFYKNSAKTEVFVNLTLQVSGKSPYGQSVRP